MIFAMLRLHIETEGNFYTEKKKEFICLDQQILC